MLKWITFTHPASTAITSSNISLTEKFAVYPNPAKTHLSIHSGFLFHTAEIFNLNGQLILLGSQGHIGNFLVGFQPGKWIISSENQW